MKAILVTIERYHDELRLDGRYDTSSGLLSMKVLILMLFLLAELVIPCTVTSFPCRDCLQYRRPWHNNLWCTACVNVPHCCMVRLDALSSIMILFAYLAQLPSICSVVNLMIL